MLELHVAALSGNLAPAVILKSLDDLPAPHVYVYTFWPKKINGYLESAPQRAKKAAAIESLRGPR
jgi:hypothetical protein